MSYQFSSNRSTTASYNSSGHTGFTPTFLPKTTEMVKSSIHNNSKTIQSSPNITPVQKPGFLTAPSKRQPRMSETAPFESYPPMVKPYEINKPYESKGFQMKQDFKSQLNKPHQQKTYQNRSFEAKHHENRPYQIKTYENRPQLKKPQFKGLQSKGYESSTQLGQNYRLNKSQFFKNKQGDKDQPWNKLLINKKKALTVNNFIKIKELGSGKYGQVSLVQQKSTGFICALKMIEKKLLKEEQITEQFIRELKIQTYLSHPNIVKMYGFFEDETHIYIILEVGTGGQLYHQLRKSEPLPEQKVAGYMKQICQAVNEIHSLRIIHRDIKPENIVIHDGIIKLCDFGWSVYQDNKLRTTFCGTPLYVCPEILKGKQYDEKIDIWSLGIMMYEMLVGQNPFKITKEEQLIKIVKEQISIPSYVFVSKQARDFLDKCLKKNPNDRVCIKQLLVHDFFLKHAHSEKEKDKKLAL